VLHPTSGSHPLGLNGHPNESAGWHQLAISFVQAVRNPIQHRLTPVDAHYAFGVVGLVSLLLTKISSDHPDALSTT